MTQNFEAAIIRCFAGWGLYLAENIVFLPCQDEEIPFVMELVIIIALFITLPLVSVVCIVIDGIHSGHSRWKIIINAVLSLLFFIVFYVVVGRVFVNSFASNQKLLKHLDQVFEQEYSAVEFEGRIQSIQTVKRYGREVSILCVDIDNSNTSDFYRFDEYMGLKIKDGVAVVPMGSAHSSANLRKYSYVKVNENHNKKVILCDNKGKTDTLWLEYCHEGMDESNMNICGCE